MDNIITTMLSSNVKNVPSCVDALAFFDPDTGKTAIISTRDYINHNYHNYSFINKTSELEDYNTIKFCNLNTFISKNPTSNIESYISARHSSRVLYNLDLYVAAYITLYKYYKSFETLVENNFITFIDTFIDTCISSNNDHLGTLCYYNYKINKIFNLRKTVFEMFRDYLTSYNNYMYIYTNQHEYKYTDKEFRVLRKTLKTFSRTQSRAQIAAKERLIETFEMLDNSVAV